MENKYILQKSIDTYGEKAIIDLFFEESAELTKALLKARRYGTESKRVADIVDEIADVTICLEYLKMIYKCDKAVDDRISNTLVNGTNPGHQNAVVYSTSKNSHHTIAEKEKANTLVASDYKDPPVVNDSTPEIEYISIFINFSFLICAVFLALCSILPHIKGIVNDICDNKCNKHKADFGGNYCVEYDGNTKPPVWLVWGGVSKGIPHARLIQAISHLVKIKVEL